MFTGLIFNRGVVKRVIAKPDSRRLEIQFQKAETGVQTGESISVNGVCLTVSQKTPKGFCADVVAETLKVTTLGFLEPGSRVHLERSLRHGDYMGGHYVSGHVDGRAQVKQIQKKPDQTIFWIEAPKKFKSYLVSKGSIALDGVSLTIQEVSGLHFKVALIPHTLERTLFSEKHEGDWLNFEADILARYGKSSESIQESFRRRASRIKNMKAQGF